MGFGWSICIVGSVDWLAAAHPLVLSPGYANFFDRKSYSCSDRILRTRYCAPLVAGYSAVPLDRGCFQQCELDSGHIGHRYRRSFRANSRRPFLRRAAELERKILSENDSTGFGRRRRGALGNSWPQLVV